jgi:HSP20 family protein
MSDPDRIRLAGPEDASSDMERFFEHLGRWKRPVFLFEKAWKPLCDVSETDEELVVVADIAGVNPESIDIAVEGQKLVMSGMRAEPSFTSNKKYHQMEINYGTFERIIVVPEKVEAERATASYEDGLLEIRLPKAAGAPPRDVHVDVSG